MRTFQIVALGLLPLFAPLPSGASAPVDAGAAAPCARAGGGAAVRVDVAHRTLLLCDGGRAEASFPVGLGVAGVGKHKTGDWKTPLGRYGLGPSHASRDFGVFIPVGYPTAEQRRSGFTGSAIGIHGPPRNDGQAALVRVLGDWTAGCIAVGTDEEIRRIDRFVRERHVSGVTIE